MQNVNLRKIESKSSPISYNTEYDVIYCAEESTDAVLSSRKTRGRRMVLSIRGPNVLLKTDLITMGDNLIVVTVNTVYESVRVSGYIS